MKLKFLRNLNNCFILDIIKDKILVKYFDNDYFIALLDFSLKIVWKVKINNLAGDYLPINLEEFIFFDDRKSYFFKTSEVNAYKQESSYYYLYKKNKKVFVNFDDSSKINVIHDLDSFFYDYENGFKLFTDNYFIFKPNNLNEIVVSSLNFQIELWRLKCENLLQSSETEEIFISQEIIEISNVIYFTLNTNNQNICFGLDAETGKVLKQFPNILGDLIQENEYIYFLYYNSITRLNTTNDTIEKWDIQELLDKEDIGYLYFPRWAVLEGQIYFSQTKGSDIHSGQQGAKFGILDFNKKELIFKGQLASKYGTIGNIKVSKERLYIHTQDSTLHIFEKE